MLSHDVRPSVCLSHAGIVSKRLNVSPNFFHSRVNHTILDFFHTELMAIFLTRASNRDLRPIYRFISEIVQDRAIVTMECA